MIIRVVHTERHHEGVAGAFERTIVDAISLRQVPNHDTPAS
jgi:hypothetical protein